MIPAPFCRPRRISTALALAAAALALAPAADAATIIKANNTNNLNLGTSWVGGVAPGASDVVVWDGTVTSPQTVALGANLSWSGLTIGSTNTVTISSGNALTLGSGGLTVNGTLTIASGATISGALAGAGNLNLTVNQNRTWSPSSVSFTGTLTLRGSSGASGAFSANWFALAPGATGQTNAFALDTGASLTNRGDFILTDALNTTTRKLNLSSLTGFGDFRSDWGVNTFRTVNVSQAGTTTYSGRFASNSA